MINTMQRQQNPTSPQERPPSRWARSITISALGSLALTAMFGIPAALAASTLVGLGFLLAFVTSGSAAAVLWIADTRAVWRTGVGVGLLAGLGIIGGGFGIVCAALILGAYAHREGWLRRIGVFR